jgi:hypothetical protein
MTGETCKVKDALVAQMILLNAVTGHLETNRIES